MLKKEQDSNEAIAWCPSKASTFDDHHILQNLQTWN